MLGDICNREVIVAYRQETIADAVRLMRQHHVGDLVIVENDGERRIPVGIVTDRDILIGVVGEGIDPREIVIEDVMSYELVTAQVDDSLEDSLNTMRNKGVRRLPIVDRDKELVGILTTDDIVDLLAKEIADLAALIRNEEQREIRKTVEKRN